MKDSKQLISRFLHNTGGSDDIIVRYLIKPKDGVNIASVVDNFILELKGNAWTNLPHSLLNKITEDENYLFELTINEHSNFAYMSVGYPIRNFDPELGGLIQLLSIIAGDNISSKKIDSLRITDIHLPDKFIAAFKGPSFGVEGVRSIYNKPEGPLLQMILKPRLGLSAEDYAELAYRGAASGVAAIRDDQMLISTAKCPFKKKVEAINSAIEEAALKTGKKALYYPNVSVSPVHLPRIIDFLRASGVRALTVNAVYSGLGAIEWLRENASDFIIQAHRSGHVVLCRNKHYSFAYPVLAQLLNLAGADEIHVGSIFGRFDVKQQEVLTSLEHMRKPSGQLKSSLPVIAGGVTPSVIEALMNQLGSDSVFLVGSGVMGHPQGVEAGIHALKSMIDITMEGSDLGFLLAKDRIDEPLLKAINLWGYTHDGITQASDIVEKARQCLSAKDVFNSETIDVWVERIRFFQEKLDDDELGVVEDALRVSGRILAGNIGQAAEKYVKKICTQHNVQYKQFYSATGRLLNEGIIDQSVGLHLDRIRRYYNQAKHKSIYIFMRETLPLLESLSVLLKWYINNSDLFFDKEDDKSVIKSDN